MSLDLSLFHVFDIFVTIITTVTIQKEEHCILFLAQSQQIRHLENPSKKRSQVVKANLSPGFQDSR